VRAKVWGALALVIMSATAQAGLLDDLKKAKDLAKDASQAAQRNPISGGQAPAAAARFAPPAAGFELTPYPRARTQGRYDNPLEVGTLPISPPERSSRGDWASRWRITYEGKVTMRQFEHERDDSPVLIARHYAGQLKELGFELVTVCERPCRTADGDDDDYSRWGKELDLGKRLSAGYFGREGYYLLGHRADAVVAVRIGTYASDYVSSYKIVVSPNLDRGPLNAYIAALTKPMADAPLPPPPGRVPSGPSGPASAPVGVALIDVAPQDIGRWIEHSKGLVVLQLSSHEAGCSFCVKANPVFAKFAAVEAGKGVQSVRVAFQPWASFGNNDFVRSYAVKGLPTTITFLDGQLMRRQEGLINDPELLSQRLLGGLR
jgi:hypothetical protein